METFTAPRAFLDNPGYARQREAVVASLDLATIDRPIADIVAAFAGLDCCFPLQSCCGHFVCGPETDRHTLAAIPEEYGGLVRYRIAYIAVCIENSIDGRTLRDALAGIARLEPAYIQFGSATWFWERHLNSYVLQVEPPDHVARDEALLEVREARHVQEVRDLFFDALRRLVCD